MDPLVTIPLALGAGVLGLMRARRNRRAGKWRARAEECGLTEIQQRKRWGGFGPLTARWVRHRVRIERFRRGKSVSGTRVVVDGVAPELLVRKEGFGTAIGKAIGTAHVTLGDTPFDDDAYVRGPEPLVRALLDAETRAALARAFEGTYADMHGARLSRKATAEITDGELRAEFRDGFAGSDEPQVPTLRALLELAARLVTPDALAPRLARVATADLFEDVRANTLALLAKDFADAPETREAMRAACDDASPAIRLRAGRWLDVEGRPTLQALAVAPFVPDGCSAAAIDALGDALAEPHAVLRSALDRSRVQTAQAVLLVLARAGAEHVGTIAPLLDDPRPDVGAAAARALGATGSASVEDVLLRALDRDSEEVRVAVARALGAVGTARSVPALNEHPARGPWASEAVARIQARLVGAAPGQVTLAGDDAGGLSLSDDAQGRVTLPDAPSADGRARRPA